MLKQIKILPILLLLNLTLFAANIDNFAEKMGFERDYNTALLKAKKVNKPLVMVLSSDYCPWCRKFENKTLKSSLIKSKLDKEFIVLLVDKKYDVKTFPSKFKTQFTPRIFFINPKDESILFDKNGYIKKIDFEKNLDKAQQIYMDLK